MRRLKQFLASVANAITRLLFEDIPVTAPGSVEMVDYYEEQLTRLSLAWLANRTGHPSEFGYRSQKELVRSFEGAVEGYQLHSRALRKRVEFAQCAFPPPVSGTELQSGREPVTSSQQPATRPHLCYWCDGSRPKRDGLCSFHLSLFQSDRPTWRQVLQEITADSSQSLSGVE